jgi:hypothetical protein
LKLQAFAAALIPTFMLKLFEIFLDEILIKLKSHERFCLAKYLLQILPYSLFDPIYTNAK